MAYNGTPLADAALVTDSTRVTAAQQAVSGEGFVVSWAGYPTGRHHSLVKAAEARLSVQLGAAEVWVCVDDSLSDENTYLADLITVREACPPPVRLALFLADTANPYAIRAAEKAGFDYLAAATAMELASNLPLVRLV